MKKMIPYLLPYRKGLLLATLAIAVSTVCDLLLPARSWSRGPIGNCWQRRAFTISSIPASMRFDIGRMPC